MVGQNAKDYDLVLINTPALDYSLIKQNDQNGVPVGIGKHCKLLQRKRFQDQNS